MIIFRHDQLNHTDIFLELQYENSYIRGAVKVWVHIFVFIILAFTGSKIKHAQR